MFTDVFVGPTTTVRSNGSLLLVVHNDATVTQEEWVACVGREAAFTATTRSARILVVPAPGGTTLTAKQRSLLRETLPMDEVRVAVLTANAAMRAVITALSWFMPDTKAFAADDLHGALRFLGDPLPPSEIQREVVRIRGGLPAPE
jgi:hypothetical protein